MGLSCPNAPHKNQVFLWGKASLEDGTACQGVEFEIEGFHFPWFAHRTYCGRTPEELAVHAGLTSRTAENLVRSIRRYNELCAAGRDDDFGKDAKLLRPLEGCLYLQPTQIQGNGFTMTTLGGLVTDEDQVVLDDAYEPIPGLYATGNCCGRRFGPQYSTPISGISIGMAITLGRAAGRTAARS